MAVWCDGGEIQLEYAFNFPWLNSKLSDVEDVVDIYCRKGTKNLAVGTLCTPPFCFFSLFHIIFYYLKLISFGAKRNGNFLRINRLKYHNFFKG